MDTNNIQVTQATIQDAEKIAEAVVMAFGDELTRFIAGDNNNASDVKRLIKMLATREVSQHSYLNVLKAVDYDGTPMGFVVAYDGAELSTLRQAMLDEAKVTLNRELDYLGEETNSEEFYIDSRPLKMVL